MLRSICCLVLCVAYLSGCSTIEEGEIDYARTVSSMSTSSSSGNICGKGAYDISTKAPAGMTRGCYETLYRKYTSVPEIKKGENISVHLMQGFLKDPMDRRSFAETMQRRAANAEIVVIVNVCEQGKLGCAQRFGPEVDKKGRVVYFSNGVKAKQYLNFSYLPVYGPIKYEGGPLILQLTIMDFDNLSVQEIGLIDSLAAAGKKAYPPASGVLSLLDTLGKGLLERNQDDIIFRFSMTLTPGTGDPGYQNPIIAEGNYAFVRKDTVKGDQEKEIWSDIKFDHLSGRLVGKCQPPAKGNESVDSETETDAESNTGEDRDNRCTFNLSTGESYRDYRDNTYLTFQIQSGFAEASLDNLQSVEELLMDLDTEKNKSATAVKDALDELGAELTRGTREEELSGLLAEVSKSLNQPGIDQVDRFSVNVVKFTDRYSKALSDFKSECADQTPPGPKCDGLLNEEQLDNVYFALRELIAEIAPAEDANTLLPGSVISQGLSDTTALNTALINGYKTSHQESVFNSYRGQLTEIDNLSVYVREARKGGNKIKIADSQQFLKQSLDRFFTQFSKDISLFIQGKCNQDAGKADACYRYPNSDQFGEITTMVGSYIDKQKEPGSKVTFPEFSELLKNGLSASQAKTIMDALALLK